MSGDVILLHGDSVALAPTIEGPINCIITDPPYGVDFSSGFAKTDKGKKFTRKIENDGDVGTAIDVFRVVMEPLCVKLADTADVYVFTSWNVLEWWMPAVKQLPDLELVNMLIWEKGWPGLGDLEANWPLSYECILYLKKGRRPIKRRRPTVLSYDRVRSGVNIHPSEKPVELLKVLIGQSTDPGDLIVDPFAGSASTLLAAREMERRAIGFEVDDAYYADAAHRLNTTMTLF